MTTIKTGMNSMLDELKETLVKLSASNSKLKLEFDKYKKECSKVLPDFDLKKEKKEKETNICPYCRDTVEVPVFWCGYSLTDDSNKLTVCEPSKKTPHCLRCAKETMKFHKENNRKIFKCWGNCCTVSSHNPRAYGEMFRKDLHGPPCPEMYNLLDSYNVGKTDCRLCGEDCGTITDLANHILKECPEREVKCNICNKLIIAKNMKKHHETCFKFCNLCGPEVRITCNPDGTTDHICPNLKIGHCKFCRNPITIGNFEKHKECPKVIARNLVCQ